jgi:cytoskeletal protein CcmA (bactofilin family)
MFGSKIKQVDTPPGSTTIIGAGTVIQGDLKSDGDIRIDGTLNGNVVSKSKLLIGNDGVIKGDVTSQDADILGNVSGDIRVSGLLQLRGQCLVQGNLYAGRLEVEPTATFNGSCHMGANVVELNAELGNAVNQ